MDLNAEKWTQVEQLSEWVKNEAEFKGRTEPDFHLMFLRSCNFDLELSKKTMNLFYQNRLNYPQWWANRDLRNPSTYDALRSAFVTILSNEDDPLVAVATLSNLGSHSGVMDEIGRVATLTAEICMRRIDCQLHGVVAIVDFYKCPMWIVMHFLWPSRCMDMFKTFVRALPVRLNKLVFLNCSPMALSAIKVLLLILPGSYRNLVHCFGSDWSKLGEAVPLRLLPEEYGGSAGPMKKHEDAFIDHVFSFNDYFLEDLKFGYQK